ncbi:uncharacterized protein MELLADRAFT_71644 [Melampsora larici-populina 98AG31]|uniref:TauD/TfdA-like domain-containing protein n=1 Tax=Melampsora larici-populina (strain 98AG31 / pathotype 3-4-7) TaxID=747676 RepID=F4RIY4_MELLP|nr:uncharacterized protein MELLADRAFT_71644 [Melampsora larici-populina 98AG31]EGG07641.1 hypothetical protein MELLADRAFT_71644 [Melampsora larici-populina 98AG31]
MPLNTTPLHTLSNSSSNLPPEFGIIINLDSYENNTFDPTKLSEEDFKELEDLLYKHSLVLWRGVKLNPLQQYTLTKRFDPSSTTYGHDNEKSGIQSKSVLHPDLKTLPSQPQVQLIGNGKVIDQEIAPGMDPLPTLKHPHHKTFHKTVVSEEDESKGYTRFYRWHIDAALYKLDPPKVTTLQALRVPEGKHQVCRYDDGTGDELSVPLGTTAFVSGQKMFEILPKELKSLAVRTKVQYAPHPLWKNPVTGLLHLQVHPSGAEKLIIDPIPSNQSTQSTELYPEGGRIEDLKKVREILYDFQRPGISPDLVYPHDWKENDLCLFHNRGVLHSVVGAFGSDQHRAFWQCNIAASDQPIGPDDNDLQKYL